MSIPLTPGPSPARGEVSYSIYLFATLKIGAILNLHFLD